MQVVTVAPIARGIPVDELSYFSANAPRPGALVRVPLRGRSVPALVLSVTPAEVMKSDLKRAGFPLRKLDAVVADAYFSRAYITATTETARFFAATTGAVIQATFPTAIIRTTRTTPVDEQHEAPPRRGERSLLQADESERLATYKSQIREAFARGTSCFLVLPSVQDIEHVFASIEKGIQEYTFIMHGGIGKTEIRKRWDAALAMKHPILVIGTATFLALPRSDIRTIILDRESASSYTLQGRPFVDMRFFVERLAAAAGADLVFGDLFLRSETLERIDRREIEPLRRPKVRIPSTARQSIVDMRESGERPASGKIAIYSAELVDQIEETRRKGNHTFIFGVRRGYAPMTVCGDCGTTVECGRCSAPMVLHQRTSSDPAKPAHVYLCHRCGDERSADLTCATCGGWRLVPLGIGVAQADESLRHRFPDAKILRLDRDTVEEHGDALAIAEEFYATPGSILIGTEMAIPYLTEQVATTAVLSVNSLLTIPDFRMGERAFRLLLLLREKASEHFIIQTRDPSVPIFELATQGNIGEFLRTELEVRHALGYPPYSILIKFTHEGTKEGGVAAMEEIGKIFGTYHPVTFPSFIAKIKGRYRMNALLRLPPGDWPNDEILSLIRALPPEIAVRVNPESVV